MSDDPFAIFEDLGSVRHYRTTARLKQTVQEMHDSLEVLQRIMAAKPSEKEKCLFALDVIEKMLSQMQLRACKCELQYDAMACENVDMFYVLAHWLRSAREQIQQN